MTISTEQFISVNVGSSANDGTGDSLRDAFIKVNENFANISDIGFDAGNINVQGAIESQGNISAPFFVGSGEFLTNLALGNVTTVGNLTTLTVTGNITASANVNVTNNIVSGNVYAQGFFLSDGSLPLDSYTEDANFTGNVTVANVYVPTSNSSAGSAGQIVWDTDYLYVCIATDTWKRANLATW